MNNPAVTACACTGEPKSILDESGQPMLVEGVVVCPRCGHNPFREALALGTKLWDEARGIRRDLPDSEGGEA
jgi:hypothetical protein